MIPIPQDSQQGCLFMDSGAHGLFTLHVGKSTKRQMGKHGRLLEPPARTQLRGGKGDYSFFNLAAGTEFRKYCDGYARFVNKVRAIEEDRSVLYVLVDVIGNPDLTWESYRYFRDAHGLNLVPVIHPGTDPAYLDRYLETDCPILGLGGLGQRFSVGPYKKWADDMFLRICPASNKRLPLVRVHGFAMTSWELMCRWPWWSVDSATWVKLSAYGWVYVPRWDRKGFRFDKPPLNVNVSDYEGPRKVKNWWRVHTKAVRHTKRHLKNIRNTDMHESVGRWLEFIGENLDDAADKQGVRSCYKARSRANIRYFQELEKSRPAWPWPLDLQVVQAHRVHYRRGFGLA